MVKAKEMPIVETREHESWRLGIMHEGREISRVRVVDRRLCIGQSCLRFGGIADVFTEPDFRNKGLSRRLLEVSLQLMTRERHDFALLFGIANYYEKWGYRTTLADYQWSMHALELLGNLDGWQVRDLAQDEHKLTLPLYRRWLKSRGFGIERLAGRWRGFTKGSEWRNKARPVGLWQKGKLRCYMVIDMGQGEIHVNEIVGDSPAALRAGFAWLADESRRRVRENLIFEIAEDDEATRLAMQIGRMTIRRSTQTSGNGMARVMNLAGLMTAMEAEFKSRWQQSHLKDSALKLTVQTDVGSCLLAWAPGGEAWPAASGSRSSRQAGDVISGRIKLPQDRLMQLLLGYRRLVDVAGDDGVSIPKSLVETGQVLFPIGQPQILRADLF